MSIYTENGEIDIKKINKTVKRMKKIFEELDCEFDEGKITCETCPFYPVKDCRTLRVELYKMRKIKNRGDHRS